MHVTCGNKILTLIDINMQINSFFSTLLLKLIFKQNKSRALRY